MSDGHARNGWRHMKSAPAEVLVDLWLEGDGYSFRACNFRWNYGRQVWETEGGVPLAQWYPLHTLRVAYWRPAPGSPN